VNRTGLIYARAALSLAALLGFIYIYGRAMIEMISTPTQPVFSDAFIYVGTALAGLVGGVAATGLGQGAMGARQNRAKSVLAGLGTWLAPNQAENFQQTLALIYTIVYIVFGVAALLLWISAKPEEPVLPMIRDLGLIFLGLALATVQAFVGGINPIPQPVTASRSRKKRP
jgi:hypothetical protein